MSFQGNAKLRKRLRGEKRDEQLLSTVDISRSHKASAAGILYPEDKRMPSVQAVGQNFYYSAWWPTRKIMFLMCKWAGENKDCIPTYEIVEGWCNEANQRYSFEEREENEVLNVARLPEMATRRTRKAVDGGVIHECLHKVYTPQVYLYADEVFPVIIKRWAQIEDWSLYSSFLLECNNIVEDIRIERLGCVRFGGITKKMEDLQDFILSMEADSRDEALKLGVEVPALSIAMSTFRDLGLGYKTQLQRDAIASYEKMNEEAFKMVTEGVLSPILKEATPVPTNRAEIEDYRNDILASVRYAMDIIIALESMGMKPEPKQDKPKPDGKVKCQGCGAPSDRLRSHYHPTDDSLIIITCLDCGHQIEMPKPQQGGAGGSCPPGGVNIEIPPEGQQQPQKPQQGGQADDTIKWGGKPFKKPQGDSESSGDSGKEGDSDSDSNSNKEDGDQGQQGNKENEFKAKDQRTGKYDNKGKGKKSKGKSDSGSDDNGSAQGQDQNGQGTQGANDTDGDQNGQNGTGIGQNDTDGDQDGSTGSAQGKEQGTEQGDNGSNGQGDEGDDNGQGASSQKGDQNGAQGNGDEQGDKTNGTQGEGQEGSTQGDGNDKQNAQGQSQGDDYQNGGQNNGSKSDEGNGDLQNGASDTDNFETKQGVVNGSGDTSKGYQAGGEAGDADAEGYTIADQMKDELANGTSLKNSGMLDMNSAIEGQASKEEQKDLKGLQRGEKKWNPLTTEEDEIRWATGSKRASKQMLKEVRRECRYLLTKLRTVVQGMEETLFDDGVPKGKRLSNRNLVRTFLDVRDDEKPQRAYMNIDEVCAPSCAVSVIVDESGSMGGMIKEAGQCALAIAEPMSKLGAAVQVSGITSAYYVNSVLNNPTAHRNYSVVYNMVKDYDEPMTASIERFSGLRAQGGTPLADGIEFAYRGIRQREEDKKIIFVITDGQPDRGHSPVMKYQRRLCKEEGIILIGVGIGSGATYVSSCFDESIHADDIRDIPKKLVKILTDLITKKKMDKKGKRRR